MTPEKLAFIGMVFLVIGVSIIGVGFLWVLYGEMMK